MPEVEYELQVAAEEDKPIAMQVVAYDSEGESLAGVRVHIEMVEAAGSFTADEQATSLDLITDSRGKAYFQWQDWPPNQPSHDVACVIRATWEGRDPFVFIERYRETWKGGV